MEEEKKIAGEIDPEEMGEDLDENFAELLEKSFVSSERLEPGQRVKAQVVKITDEWIFLDLGGKSEGYLDRKELTDDQGELTVKEGDFIQAYLLSSKENELRFTTRIGAGEAGQALLEEAWQNGIPVEGVVEKEIKGGYEVKLMGKSRGFCPFSQIGLQRQENPAEIVGKRLPFVIKEFGERGRNVILSHRAVLEEEQREKREALRQSLQEGAVVRGKVVSVRDFGAFVDIGGIEGLVPISEIGWGRVEDIHEAISVGQEMDVVITKLDWDNNRFSFSIRKTLADPWEDVHYKFPEGSRHTGTVVRLTNFGAFVSLAEGVDGLLHISKLGRGKRIHHPRDVVSVGQSVEIKVDAVDRENKRLSLSFAGAADEESRETAEEEVRYVAEAPRSMGTLGDLLKAKLDDQRKKKK